MEGEIAKDGEEWERHSQWVIKAATAAVTNIFAEVLSVRESDPGRQTVEVIFF